MSLNCNEIGVSNKQSISEGIYSELLFFSFDKITIKVNNILNKKSLHFNESKHTIK